MSVTEKDTLSDSISLRPVREEDGPFLLDLYASTREEELACVPWSQEEKRHFLESQFEAQQTHYQEHFSDSDWMVILQHKKPAGRLYLGRWEEEFRIIDIALLPAYRGKGIGGFLLAEILEEARQASKPVRIHVEKFNRARRLYLRLGFQAISDNGVYDFMEWNPNNGNE
ncbi:MAG: GNAT family N-acetyltransferase [Candidatus Omnitrophica bacterium]|nr:GNAT family N-acetyltransferase [Candidatus Omnitrophota bacterium]